MPGTKGHSSVSTVNMASRPTLNGAFSPVAEVCAALPPADSGITQQSAAACCVPAPADLLHLAISPRAR